MRLAALAIGCLVPLAAFAVEEPFCTVPEQCVDDLLSIRFPANGTSELNGVLAGDTFDAEVFIDVKSSPLQGFVYGIEHDIGILEIRSATDRGVDPVISDAPNNGGPDFKRLQIAHGGQGLLQSVVITLDQVPPLALPVQDGVKTAIARYRVRAAVPGPGTKIHFTNDLGVPAFPNITVTTQINVEGKAHPPRTVNNAIVKSEDFGCLEPGFGFYFGPQASSNTFAAAGADRLPITLRNASPVLGFSLGIKKNADTLTFDSNLGLPPVELAVTRVDGSEVTGDALKGNSARGVRLGISDVAKGAALAGPAGDFFGKRILPAGVEGGPGATVGYVVDATGNNRVIPAVTDTPTDCGGQEILVVTFGGGDLGLSRGDANGDGRINVTDGVLVAQNIFANQFVVFDCKDMLDANDDGLLNTADPVFLLSYIFLKGPRPQQPFLACGIDPTPDTLTCAQPNCR